MSSATANRSSRVTSRFKRPKVIGPFVRCLKFLVYVAPETQSWSSFGTCIRYTFKWNAPVRKSVTGSWEDDPVKASSIFLAWLLYIIGTVHTITTDSSTLLSKIGERRSFCWREKKVMIRRGWIGERTTKWLRKGKRNFVIIVFNRISRLNLAQYFFLLQRRIPNTNVFSLAFSKEEEERLCKAIESFLFPPNNTSPFSSIRQSLSLRSVYFNRRVASTLDPTTLLPRWKNFFKPPTCRHSSIQLPV